MSTCGSVGECIGGLMPNLMLAKLRCPEGVRQAEAVVRELMVLGDEVCSNATLDAQMRGTFEPGGAFFELATCAASTMQLRQEHISFLAWAPFRGLICGPLTFPPADDGVRPPLPPYVRFTLLSALLVAISMLAAATRAVLTTSPAFHRALMVGWAVVALSCLLMVAATSLPRVDVDGFYFQDTLTECAFEFEAALPEADLRTRVTSIVAPVSSLGPLYDEVRAIRIHGVTLRELCGHCMAYAFGLATESGLNEHLILGRPFHGDDELGLLNLLIPSGAPRDWMAAWTDALQEAASAHASAAFVNIHQVEHDLANAIAGRGWMYGTSVCLTTTVLVVAVNVSFSRNVCASLAVALSVVGVVAASIAIGEAVSRMLSVPVSPYNAVIAPIILGTGVDSALLLMNAFKKTRGFDHAWPSIIASQATTVLSFAVGTLLPVAHIRAFFVHSVLTLGVSFFMQVGCFSYLARRVPYDDGESVQQAGPTPDGKRPPSSARASIRPPQDWRWSTAALVVVWVSVVPFIAPLRLDFNLQNQVAATTPTYRFLAATEGSVRSRSVPLYAFVRNADANWTDVRSRLHALDATPVIDWRADFDESGEESTAAWRRTPAARLMYGGFGDEASGASALYASLRVDDSLRWEEGERGGYTSSLQALARASTSEFCFASFDLMDGHTLSRVVDELWKLSLASSIICTAFAVIIARQHGLVALLALGLSYALTLATVAALRLRVHMMLVAVFLIAPGLLTDFMMHMMYNVDSRTAVMWSALTSVLSITPYFAAPARGVRDFALVYALFIGFGLLHALAATCTRAIPYTLIRRDTPVVES